MADNLLVIVVSAALFAGLAMLFWRARRVRSVLGRVLVMLPLGLLAVIFLAVTLVLGRGLYLVSAPLGSAAPDVTAGAAPERIARGEHLARALCVACHGANGELPLSGGLDLARDLSMPVGHFYASNLTPAGELAGWTDGDILRVLRTGVAKDGRPLLAMPARNLRHLSDEDALSIIAFLRSQPRAGAPAPRSSASPLGLAFVGAGLFPVGAPPQSGPVAAPKREISAAYGEYVLNISDCRDCHGVDLRGGKPPAPAGPSLQMIGAYTREGFIQAMRTGVRPWGLAIQPPMPWKYIAAFDDVELAALYEYLRTVQ